MLSAEQRGCHQHLPVQDSVAAERLGALLLHLPILSDEILKLRHDVSAKEGHLRNELRDSKASIDSSSNDSTYTYSSLLEKERTRILTLESGKFDDELRGSLRHIESLRDNEYEALSYACGDKTGSNFFNCGGKKIHITSNLDSALRALRFEQTDRKLWVDAICIHEEDQAEKSRQVRQMGEIYGKAKSVLVWLGEADPKDAHAFQSLRQLKTQLQGQHVSSFWTELGWYREQSGKIVSGGGFHLHLGNINHDHLVQLLRRRWFRRTWVIQEVASARNAVVHCGKNSMPWEAFAEVYMLLGDQFIPFDRFYEDPLNSLENINALETARRANSGPLSMSLFHILVATSLSHCEDKRDKIFAVLGLARDEVVRRIIIPDYTSKDNYLETYKHFAVADTCQNRDLRILSCASGPDTSRKLPSWVPDWTNIRNQHPFVRYGDRTGFSATPGKAEAWYSENNNILNVTGKEVDSIKFLGSEPTFTKAIAGFEINEDKITDLKKSFSWLKECQDLVSQCNKPFAKRHEMLWRTLTCGLTEDAFPVHNGYSSYFAEYMKFAENAAEEFENYIAESKISGPRFRRMHEVIPNFRKHALVEASLFKWSSKRRFCMTKYGRAACVPQNSKKGDVICILFGAEVPYVLRPMGKGFHSVVGECYVDDIMYGESLLSDTRPRDFHLQ